MKKLVLFYIITAIIACAICFVAMMFVSKNNEKKELSHPEIFKGIKLGYDITHVNDTLEKNGGCEILLTPEYYCKYMVETFRFPMTPKLKESNRNCQYAIDSEIYASPQFFYSKYKGDKVLSEACLLFHCPTKFPSIDISDFDNQENNYDKFNKFRILNGLPAVTKMQVDKIISMYDSQFGLRSKNGYFTEYSWEKDDLSINLYVYEYGKDIKFFEGEIVQKDAYQVVVKYSYNKEINSLLEHSKTTNDGEVIGDKI